MKIKPGWYRTRAGERAYVGCVAPAEAVADDFSHALGWIVAEGGTWMVASWSETGRIESGKDADDLMLPENMMGRQHENN